MKEVTPFVITGSEPTIATTEISNNYSIVRAFKTFLIETTEDTFNTLIVKIKNLQTTTEEWDTAARSLEKFNDILLNKIKKIN